jgi:hypothetical protein
MLPGGTGFDVLDFIKVGELPPLNSVVITAADGSLLMRLDRSMVKTVMFKPIALDNFVATVSALVFGQSKRPLWSVNYSGEVDPLAPQLLIDYDYFCRRFGHLAFGEFVVLWHAADVVMQSTIDDGFDPHEVPDLIFPDLELTDTVHWRFLLASWLLATTRFVFFFRPQPTHHATPRFVAACCAAPRSLLVPRSTRSGARRPRGVTVFAIRAVK